MKIRVTFIFAIFIVLISSSTNAEEEIKFRGVSTDNSEFKQTEIKISKDFLNVNNKYKDLNFYFDSAENYSLKITKDLKERKKIKFRGGAAKNIYKNNVNKVVFLLNYNEDKPEMSSTGAGFLVDESGLIVSNWHVTEGAKNKKILVWPLPDEGPMAIKDLFKKIEPFVGEILGENKKEDLAFIRVHGLPSKIKKVKLASKNVEPGDDVYAIGHPQGLPWSFTTGVVSQVRKDHEWAYSDDTKHVADVIQTQTPISPGNSGGPLFSSTGEVVGINTAGKTGGQNLNFSVSINHAVNYIKSNPDFFKKKPLDKGDAIVKKMFPKAISIDHNKNGIMDTWLVDMDGNGKIDSMLIDDDEDGYAEAMMIDKDENGKWDGKYVDTDNNGKFDLAFLDKDEDGTPDFRGIDYNEDGEWDKVEKLS